MIESEFEYKQYLRNVRGLVEGTCNSYPTYLMAISKYLKIDITSQTVTSKSSVKITLDNLTSTGMDRSYWGNCQSALRAYLTFLQHDQSNVLILPDEKINFVEGSCVEVKVNRFERDPKARIECIKYHLPICKVCHIDFSIVYGEIGNGFIHVHHIKPLSQIGGSYKVDPINDLVPVCPNCHAMLHTKNPPYTVSELKQKVTV